MFPLEPYEQIRLQQRVVNHNRTSRYERKVEDVLKEADFAGRYESAISPQPPESRRLLDLRALFGRLSGRPRPMPDPSPQRPS